MKRTILRKLSKNPKSKLRRQADSLLQEYIRAKHKGELCWACGNEPVFVGHHYINKQNSNALRYYIPNIIPVCKNCHMLVHSQPHLVEPKICFKLGEAWYQDLMDVKRRGIKENLGWYYMNINVLSEMSETLKGGC